jgi:hypothetical protein
MRIQGGDKADVFWQKEESGLISLLSDPQRSRYFEYSHETIKYIYPSDLPEQYKEDVLMSFSMAI